MINEWYFINDKKKWPDEDLKILMYKTVYDISFFYRSSLVNNLE